MIVSNGLFGTAAAMTADLTLLMEILMGGCLLIGALLARRKRYWEHAWCQSAVVLLNLLLIVAGMIPSFRANVAPKIPARLGRSFYALATVHAVLGSVVEVAGVYVLLAAGTQILPAHLRIREYKTTMRTLLILWWLVLLLGLITYVRWYVPHLF